MGRLMHRRSMKVGLPPGTPVYVGDTETEETRVTLFDYDDAHLIARDVTDIDECIPLKDTQTVTWINVDGLKNQRLLERMGEVFGLHPLVREDILNTEQRPKLEDYDTYDYLVLKMLRYDKEENAIDVEQVSIILGPNFVISFQEKPGDVFDIIRDRIRTNKGRIRKMGSDYLAYALLDAVIDNYFTILENVSEQIELLEDNLIENPDPEILTTLHELKREVIYFKKAVWPLRELLSALIRNDSKLIKKTTQLYIRDLYDHTVQVIDSIETFRDLIASTLDIYLSSVSNKMNQVMKVLTIIATIFIPLTFIAGVYGMNFKYMPELEWRPGYFVVLGVMLAIGVTMVVLFRRKRWL